MIKLIKRLFIKRVSKIVIFFKNSIYLSNFRLFYELLSCGVGILKLLKFDMLALIILC